MDARTVLACAPTAHDEHGALHSDTELLSWFTSERSRHDVRARLVPLNELPDWRRGDATTEHVHGRYFRVVGVQVEAGNREVTGWTQPLFEPCGLGVTAFLARRIDGVPHVLAHARVEGGFLDTVELGPTVQYTPDNHAHLTGGDRPPFLDLVLSADPSRIRYEARHSEEGGRFLNAESRCLVVDVDGLDLGGPDISRPDIGGLGRTGDRGGSDAPAGYRWVTPGQLNSLSRHGHYVNVQARTLLACFNSGAVRW